jgi:putative ABC transport system permease protein
VRTYGGQFALLAVLAMVAALLVTAVPRVANRLAETGLREHVAAQPSAIRDITFAYQQGALDLPPSGTGSRAGELAELQDQMPPELRRAIGERWYAAQTGLARATGPDLARNNLMVDLGLRAMSGAEEAATMVEGRWPANSVAPRAPIEAVISAGVADGLGLRVGSRLGLALVGESGDTELVIVGIFRPIDPGAGVWDSLPSLLRTAPPPEDVGPTLAVALTSDAGINSQLAADSPVTFTWRYRITPERLDVAEVDAVADAIQRLDRNPPGLMKITQGVDGVLREFIRALAAARTLLAVVSAGVLATLGGLIGLAARLAVQRRREEFVLLRARGGALTAVAGRCLAESLLVIPVAAALGWSIGLAVPGRPAETGWLVGLVVVITTLALPVAAVASRPAVAGRRDLVGVRASTRRLTFEISVLAVAALGVILLRRRGLTPGAVDPLLVSVPVLLAVAAGVIALRIYPWPLRLVGRLAARARGTVAFLGMARAGRSATAAPLIVVVVAVATAAFSGVVAAGIEDGRDRAADLVVPADALITGDLFAPDTADALAALPGVRAVTPVVAEPAQRLSATADPPPNDLDQVFVLVVDAPAFARVAAQSGARVDVPGALIAAGAGAGPVPALVSPSVAADAAGNPFVTVQDGRYEFQVAAVAESFPTISRSTSRFVVLPGQALPARANAPLIPTGFLLAGTTVDPTALQRTGDEGQRRHFTTGLVTGKPPARPAAVTDWSAIRARLGGGGANGMLFFGFGAGTAGGAMLGLLAIAFAVLAGARARGRVLSRLRTMGLSRPQWRGLLVFELAPLVGVSVLTGAAVGALLPLLLTPALGLSAFTGGSPVRVRFEPGLVGGVLVLGGLALVTAIGVEATINRRLRLGEALRLGEES